jgi:predicted 3-demethylubiquinone-9 3-methyltransferase (glyoxalase superfamily)
MSGRQKITTFLWFQGQAAEAADYYVSIFEDSEILEVTRYGEAGPGPKGSVMTVTFRLEGQEFMALNGGPEFRFTEAVSLLVRCESQEEVDTFWEKLSADGEEGPCGWLKDKFGLSWQVAPARLLELIHDRDPAKVRRVMEAMFEMKKIDIARLEEAYGRK